MRSVWLSPAKTTYSHLFFITDGRVGLHHRWAEGEEKYFNLHPINS